MQFYPVIHHRDLPTTMANVEMVVKAGCNYVTLIQMEGNDSLLDSVAQKIQRDFALNICINRLSCTPLESIRKNKSLNIPNTWADSCGLHSTYILPEAEQIRAELSKHQFFGSVAFKYQVEESNPAKVAKLAYDYGFIPVTSGSATGLAANLYKIEEMASVLPSHTLGIASGITVDNIRDYLPFVGHYFVATGISHDFHTFDAEKVKQMMDIIGSQ